MKLIIALGTFFVPSILLAASPDLDFHYSAGAQFIYSDSPSGDNLNLSVINTQSQTSSQGGNRTLGLQRVFIDLQFKHQFSYLSMRLRPDAGLERQQDQDQVQLELDTRSGTNYRNPAALKLLDTYEIGFLKTKNFNVSYGVVDYAYRNREAYESPLDFGLQVWFPRKFSSFAIAWESSQDLSQNLENIEPPRYHFSLFTLETTDDRHEKLSYGDRSSDTAPVANDPHTGVGFIGSYRPNRSHTFELFSGYMDTKVDFGRKSRLMASAASMSDFYFSKQRLSFSYNLRYSKERWSVSQGNYPELEQLSQTIKLSYLASRSRSFFTGISHGVSQRPLGSDFGEKEIHSGYQFDLGYQAHLYDHLKIAVVLTDEVRDVEEAGVSNGGFIINDETINRLNRLGVQLSYYVL
ncbi:hypothetical protein [Pseudobacteriovorax antillogorgiicola]|uniref:Uncharacterized protein n=1 Tax=Pseudobacteriovorax antillogorgiicola TaxID=1513793 RepID=A0A1Y6CPP2_9BACT|nr:hypothetical protein [Pseudobacteriovorax antillogorgiicola]TCS46665.1 hypothetical protein EDD56_12341 [Pseudobacteriovorax antillogorgiicola]SMF66557.1 hypothetical protein SAMN06296036_12341 [Pseudobacteriovorax antillogorgiicola]